MSLNHGAYDTCLFIWYIVVITMVYFYINLGILSLSCYGKITFLSDNTNFKF